MRSFILKKEGENMFKHAIEIKGKRDIERFLKVYYGEPIELDKGFKSQKISKDSDIFKKVVELINKN